MNDISNFLLELQSDVIADSSEGGQPHLVKNDERPVSDFRECAFTRIIIDDLTLAGVLESPVECHYRTTVSGLIAKINAYGIPEEDSRLDLVISEYFAGDEIAKLSALDVERTFNQALRFFKACIEGKHSTVEAGSDEYAMMNEIYSYRNEFDRIQIFFVTNGAVVQRKAKVRKEKFENYQVSYDVWDIERLRRFRSSGATHEPIEVDITESRAMGLPCVTFNDESLGYSSCVAMIPGELLHDWYDDYGSRLLELNVRSYLQAKGKINKGILETLLKEPHYFLAYNNGITIVAEQIIFNATKDRVLGLRGLQIVNGGQTTASIHRAKKDNSADLSKVFVQAKLTVVANEDFERMVPLISKYSNSQNKVTEVDLGANHNFHVGVERVSKKSWVPGEQSMWFYERARGSYQTERAKQASTSAQKIQFDRKYPTAQRVSKEDLARYSNVWDGLPYIVSRGGQKNFTKFMESVPKTDKDWEPSPDDYKRIVSKAILFKCTQKIAKDLEVPAFKINVVTYTVAILAENTARRIDLIEIWNLQDISEVLRKQITDWMPRVAEVLISSVGDRHPTEWFKNEQCWRNLKEKSKDWKLSNEFSSELRNVTDSPVKVSAEVQNNMARCLEIDAATWFRIQLWGAESGKLQAWQIGIANTLAGYAAQGWEKRPSPKQADHGMKIVQLFNEDLSVL